MPTLAEQMLEPESQKQSLIQELAEVFEAHVAKVGGLKGMGLRTAIGMLKKARDNAIPEAVAKLLPACLRAMEPYYQRYLTEKTTGQTFVQLAERERSKVAQDLVRVIDARVANSQHSALSKGYGKVRGLLVPEIEAIVPEMAASLQRRLKV